MKMKFKKITALLLCGMLGGMMVACGPTTTKPPVGGQPGDGDGELKGKLVIALEWSGQDQQLVQAVIDAYETVNPKVDVEYKAVSSDDYKSYLETSLSSDDLSSCPFDIVFNNRIPSFLNTKKFVDYSQYLYEETAYNGNQIWADTLDPSAYTATGAKGEIFRLSFQNTQVAFAYNKDIIDEVGVDPSEFETWDGFVGACEKIAARGYTPLALGGDMESFSGRQMAWIMNVYVDQYFRSVAETVHSQPQDYNYDERIDSVWEYTPYPTITEGMTEEEIAEAWQASYYNDNASVYTQNELRLLKAIQNDELGPINKKYQNLLANLAQVLPKYTLPNFTSNTSQGMIAKFFNQNAAITLQQVYYVYNQHVQRGKPFNLQFFDFPAMSSNQDYAELKDYGPDVNYTRSYGGALGNFGIVNKNTEQTRLCIDFMKFWSSPQGLSADFAMREALGAPLLNTPLVKGVEIPKSLLHGYEPLPFKGSPNSNPALKFSIGLSGESYSQAAYQRYVISLFETTPTYSSISSFATRMQNDIKTNMYNYLANRGYDPECLMDVSANPF